MRHSLLLLLILMASICACTNQAHVASTIKQPGTDSANVQQWSDLGSVANRTSLRVMTFNILWQGYADDGEYFDSDFAHRKPLILDVLTKFGADIISLQEASIEQRAALAAGLPGFVMFPLPAEAGDECILYRLDRFDLRDDGHEMLRQEPEKTGTNVGVRDFVWVYLEDRISGKRFYVLNLHADHRSSERGRQLDGVLIGEWIRKRKFADPVILTGDFNGKPDQPRYLYLTGQRAYAGEDGATVRMPMPMLDTFAVANPHARYTGTYNAGLSGEKNREQIDHIFVPRGSTVIDSGIIYYHADGYYPSDHFPLLSEFKLE
ncbi:MAG: endonuclease/exonuclease/phosphatase family protein [Gammaproteobacteria bacterium]